MEVTVKTGEALNAVESLRLMAHGEDRVVFPTRTSYRLAVLQTELNTLLDVYREKAKELIVEHGGELMPMGPRFKNPEGQEAFRTGDGELRQEKLTFHVNPIPLQRLVGKEISHIYLAALLPFLIEWEGVEGRDERAMVALAPFLVEDVNPKQVIKALSPFLLEVETDEGG